MLKQVTQMEHSVFEFNRTPEECEQLINAFKALSPRRKQESHIRIEEVAALLTALEADSDIDLQLLESKFVGIEHELALAATYGPLEEAIKAFRAECVVAMKSFPDDRNPNNTHSQLQQLNSRKAQELAVQLTKAEVNLDAPPEEIYKELAILRSEMERILATHT